MRAEYLCQISHTPANALGSAGCGGREIHVEHFLWGSRVAVVGFLCGGFVGEESKVPLYSCGTSSGDEC